LILRHCSAASGRDRDSRQDGGTARQTFCYRQGVSRIRLQVPGTAHDLFSTPVYAGLDEDCPIDLGNDSKLRLQHLKEQKSIGSTFHRR
jgi:hypothetical protein